MLKMEQIKAAMYEKMKFSGRQTEKQLERNVPMEGGHREHIIRWFVDTQAAPLLCNGSFPPWFQGFISRQEAEDQLGDRNVGCFLIRLSEKGIGYILSYKGFDRCRHFVINQTSTGLLVVSGDSTTHNHLTELLDHFKTTPIQPFGEYLTSSTSDSDSVEEDSKKKLYDVVQSKPIIQLGVSVKALKSLWEQTADPHHKTSSVLPHQNGRKLTTSTSFDRDSHSQDMRIPPLPKKNTPLRNSLSTGHVGSHPSHDKQCSSEIMTSGRAGLDERFQGIRSNDSWEAEDGLSEFKRSENVTPISKTNPTNMSLIHKDEHSEKPQSLAFEPCNHLSSSLPRLPTIPPNTVSCSYTFLVFEKAEDGQFPHIGQADLQPNPLYEGVCSTNEVQTDSDYDNRTKTIYKINKQSDNDIYEHILETHGNDTYEVIPALDNNTYASLEEMQPHTEKKNHKWWKFHSESKKK